MLMSGIVPRSLARFMHFVHLSHKCRWTRLACPAPLDGVLDIAPAFDTRTRRVQTGRSSPQNAITALAGGGLRYLWSFNSLCSNLFRVKDRLTARPAPIETSTHHVRSDSLVTPMRASGRSVLTPPCFMRLTAHSACLRSSFARRKNRNVLCVVFLPPTPPSHGVYVKGKEHFCFACPHVFVLYNKFV